MCCLYYLCVVTKARACTASAARSPAARKSPAAHRRPPGQAKGTDHGKHINRCKRYYVGCNLLKGAKQR